MKKLSIWGNMVYILSAMLGMSVSAMIGRSHMVRAVLCGYAVFWMSASMYNFICGFLAGLGFDPDSSEDSEH